MRITVATGLYPPQIGGPATYAKLLKDTLPSRGIEVQVVNFGDVLVWPKVVRHIIYFFRVYKASRGASFIYALDPVSVGVPAFLAARLRGVHFAVKIVGDYAWEQGVQRFGVEDDIETFSKKKGGYGFFVQLLKKVERWVGERSELVIVPSVYLQTIVANWGIKKTKIEVIFNAFEGIGAVGNKAALRTMLGFEGKLIISAGRLVPWKGFMALIELMPNLLEKLPDAKLVIAGDGPMKDELQARIEELKLTESVTLLGSLDQRVLHSYIRAADVFVLNTAYEGFSHLLLEVMALETPIITTDVGGNPELITDGKNGVLIEPNNARALSSAIIQILSSSACSNSLVVGGQKRITDFSEEKMIASLIKKLR